MQTKPLGWDTALDNLNHMGALAVDIAGAAYGDATIAEAVVEHYLFDTKPSIGNACAAALTLTLLPQADIPKMAKIGLQYRLELGKKHTDWMPKGTYYISTRKASGRYIELTCYDAMLMAEQDYITNETADDWPKPEAEVVAEISARLGLPVDGRTVIGTGAGHMVNMPVEFTMREVLQHIGCANGGNWTVTNEGRLYLVPLKGGTGDALPPVTGAPDLIDALTVTGLCIHLNETDTLEAGNSTGYVLEGTDPDATAETLAELWAVFKDMPIQPYRSEQRHIDPAGELGDAQNISGCTYRLDSMKATLGPAYYADLESPAETPEAEDEYPYLTQAQRVYKKVSGLSRSYSTIEKDQERIKLEVAENKTALTTVEAEVGTKRRTFTGTPTPPYDKGDLWTQGAGGDLLVCNTAKGSGDKYAAADWVSASKYTDDTKADALAETLTSEYSTTQEMNSAIEQSANTITATVQEGYTALTKSIEYSSEQAKADAEQYTDAVTDAKAEAVTAAWQTQLQQTSQDLTLTITATNDRVTEQDEALTEYKEENSTYFRYSDEGMEIGKKINNADSPFSMILSEKKMSFRQYSVEVAYIQYNRMHINAIEAMDRLSVGAEADGGYFDFISTQYGMGIKWRDTPKETPEEAVDPEGAQTSGAGGELPEQVVDADGVFMAGGNG